eukprot:1323793-Alexandrium_andersonii.AAC.1
MEENLRPCHAWSAKNWERGRADPGSRRRRAKACRSALHTAGGKTASCAMYMRTASDWTLH